MRRVILESPFAGDIERNLRYLRAALRDSFMRGEAPFASHGLYTLEGVLDDRDPAERELGIEAGFVWGQAAELTAAYIDLGVTEGMKLGIARAFLDGRKVEYRSLPRWRFLAEPTR